MTVYNACQEREAAGGVSCEEVDGVQVNKNIKYHNGTELPKKFTYDLVSKGLHTSDEIVSFYYENTNYDAQGNITNVVEAGTRFKENPKNVDLREKASLPTRNYTFTYDTFNRITSEINPQFGNLNYSYDPESGMLKEIKKDNEIIKSFVYDAGRLTNIYKNGKIYKIDYDFYGNILCDGEAKLRYNSRNLMESYEFNDNTESDSYIHSYRVYYSYNHQGIRYRKKCIEEVTGMSPIVKNVNYYLSGNFILGEDWTDNNGNITKKLRYFYDADGICGIRYDGYNFTLIKDSLGNVSKVLYKGKIIGEYLYDAWGNCNVNEISIANERDRFVLYNNPFRYKGYYCDLETNMFWLSSRYYSPELCRFISPDSVDYLDPSSINGLNLYAYCNNDPINYADPSGHVAISIGLLLAIGGIVGAVIGAGASVAGQYLANGCSWENFSWGQLALDTVLGGVSGMLSMSPLGWGTMIAANAGIGFVGAVGGHLINGSDFSKLSTWVDIGLSTGLGALVGVVGGPGALNAGYLNGAKQTAGFIRAAGLYDDVLTKAVTGFYRTPGIASNALRLSGQNLVKQWNKMVVSQAGKALTKALAYGGTALLIGTAGKGWLYDWYNDYF